MGASLALAGVSGCMTSEPPEKIVPYVRMPEQLVPGKPLYYATVVPLAGYATGVLAESHMGRPTMVEGNPGHPDSLGAIDPWTQATVLTLYDPDRSQVVTRRRLISTWDAFLLEAEGAIDAVRAAKGAGLRILTETVTSPTLARQLRDAPQRPARGEMAPVRARRRRPDPRRGQARLRHGRHGPLSPRQGRRDPGARRRLPHDQPRPAPLRPRVRCPPRAARQGR